MALLTSTSAWCTSRELEMEPEVHAQFVRRMIACAHAHDASMLVNGDVTLARKTNSNGIHVVYVALNHGAHGIACLSGIW